MSASKSAGYPGVGMAIKAKILTSNFVARVADICFKRLPLVTYINMFD